MKAYRTAVTLISSQPEVQYVALRNINLLLQAQPDILTKEIRVFFCKYNDPPYVKLEKLDIMIRIANEKNIDQLLMELKEYALEVDMDFVKRAVKAIGQCAIKIDAAAERCVTVLLDLINTKVNYVVQEAIVVVKVCIALFGESLPETLLTFSLPPPAGYLPQIPWLRRHHSEAMREHRRSRRAQCPRSSDLDRGRVCGKDQRCWRDSGPVRRELPR